MRTSTYIKEIDLQIFLDIEDNILTNLCLTNKYINSICPDIYRIKILDLYPNLPIPNDYDLKKMYYQTKESYVQLLNFANKYHYQSIIDWINLPINKINYLIDIKVEGKTIGKRNDEKILIHNQIIDYLIKGIIPQQRTINKIFIRGASRIVPYLLDKRLFPDQEAINIAAENGYYELSLVEYNLYPDQEAINIATENNKYLVINDLAKLGKIPDQDVINLALLDNKTDIIEALVLNGIYPDQEFVNLLIGDQYEDMLQLLAEYNIYPDF